MNNKKNKEKIDKKKKKKNMLDIFSCSRNE